MYILKISLHVLVFQSLDIYHPFKNAMKNESEKTLFQNFLKFLLLFFFFILSQLLFLQSCFYISLFIIFIIISIAKYR